jgi:ABC-2 type transport system ATP-binding protein
VNGVAVEADRLTKHFGSVSAVEGISLTVTHGRVTGLLGPNGAGKSTTLRMLLGLIRPDEGTAVIGGSRYVDLPDPTARVGAVIDGGGLQPSLTARQHLRVHAALGGHDDERVETVSALLGTDAFARRRVRTFSLGMRQRLSVATALLGDPSILILDEPANGLDPAGIAWLRGFLRDFADRGGAVLLASHVLSEVEQIVDDVILIDRGRTIRRGSLGDLTDGGQRSLEDVFLTLTSTGSRTGGEGEVRR